MGEDVFLPDGAAQPLDGGARMLLPARVDDRLGAQLMQHPAHARELRRRHRKGVLAPSPLGFHVKLAPRFGIVVQDQIAYDPGREVGYRGDLPAAIVEPLTAHHLTSPQLVARRPGPAMRHCRGTVLCGRIPVGVVVGSHPNQTKFHRRADYL